MQCLSDFISCGFSYLIHVSSSHKGWDSLKTQTDVCLASFFKRCDRKSTGRALLSCEANHQPAVCTPHYACPANVREPRLNCKFVYRMWNGIMRMPKHEIENQYLKKSTCIFALGFLLTATSDLHFAARLSCCSCCIFSKNVIFAAAESGLQARLSDSFRILLKFFPSYPSITRCNYIISYPNIISKPTKP